VGSGCIEGEAGSRFWTAWSFGEEKKKKIKPGSANLGQGVSLPDTVIKSRKGIGRRRAGSLKERPRLLGERLEPRGEKSPASGVRLLGAMMWLIKD